MIPKGKWKYSEKKSGGVSTEGHAHDLNVLVCVRFIFHCTDTSGEYHARRSSNLNYRDCTMMTMRAASVYAR